MKTLSNYIYKNNRKNNDSLLGQTLEVRKKEHDRARAEVHRLITDCTNMQSDANSLKVKMLLLRQTLQDVEYMLDNLLSYGITERDQHEKGYVRG